MPPRTLATRTQRGRVQRGGTIEIDRFGIELDKYYTFEETLADGRVLLWTDIKPVPGRDGRVMFHLPPQDVPPPATADSSGWRNNG